MTRHRANRNLILAALQAGDRTHSELVSVLGLGVATVSRWLRDITERNEAYICRMKTYSNGGPLVAVYRLGAKPERLTVRKPKIKPPAQRMADKRAAQLKSGEYEDVLARRRALRWKNKPVARDALTAAFFGEAR